MARLKVVEGTAMMFGFYRRVARTRLLDVGLASAMAAYALRAAVGGYMVPVAVSSVAAFVATRSQASLRYAVLLLLAGAAIYAGTEWLFRPFWDGIAEAIVEAKVRVLSAARRGGLPVDLVGSLANDVDFIMWNFGSFYNTLAPNLLSYAVSVATIYSFSPALAAANLAFLLPSLAVIEAYMRRVEEVRGEERRQYGAVIYYSNKALVDGADASPLLSALRRWRGAIGGNILLDRVYWSTGLAIMMAAPAATVLAAAQMGLATSSLVGAAYASLNAYSSLVNGLWGLALIGQNRPAIRRVEALASAAAAGPEEGVIRLGPAR